MLEQRKATGGSHLGTTRAKLGHRRLDRFGVRRDELRGGLDGEGGWSGLLSAFARAAT